MKSNALLYLLILLLFSCKEGQKPIQAYVKFGNSKVHYKVIGKGDKNLVFIHGWGCDMNVWNNQIDYFSKNSKVILIDLPGFGESSKEIESYDIDFLAESVKAVLDGLKIKDPILIGHSLGHPVARQLIKNNPDLKATLCIVDGVYFNFPSDSLAKKDYQEQLIGFVNLFSGEGKNDNIEAFINSLFIDSTPESVKVYTDSTMKKVPDHVGLNTMRHLIDEKYWSKEPLNIPTMAVYANIPELPDDNEDVLKGWYPNLQYYEIDSVGHFLMMESPKEFNKLLHGFVQ